MKVLHIFNDIPNCGNGIVNAGIDIACMQAQMGYIVGIASGGGGYEALVSQYHIQHFYCNHARKLSNALRLLFRLRQIIQQFKPDIVHCHMITGVVMARILQLFFKFKLVAHIQNVHQKASILMGLAELALPVSQSVALTMEKRGIPKSKMMIVPNYTIGSPRDKFNQTSETEISLNKPAIITVAGLFYRKGIDVLIEAFDQISEKHHDVHLYILGEGTYRNVLENLAEKCFDKKRIHFEGFVKAPQQYLRQCSIFVLASRAESYGIVLNEAREAGCAIVASNVDGIPEVLGFGKYGLLIEPDNVQQLALSLDKLLSEQAVLLDYQHKAKQDLDQLNVVKMTKLVGVAYETLFPQPGHA